MGQVRKYWPTIQWIIGLARGNIRTIFLLTLIGSLISLCGVGFAILSRTLIDHAVAGQIFEAWKAGAIFVLLIFIEIALNSTDSIVSVKTWNKLANNARQRIFNHLTCSIWGAFSKFHSGDLMTRMDEDVEEVVDGIVETMPGIVAKGVRFMAAFTVLMHFEPLFAFFALVFGPITFFLTRIIGRSLKLLHARIQEAEGRSRGFLQEVLQNMLTIKAFELQNHSVECFEVFQRQRLHEVMKRNMLGVRMNAVKSLGSWCGYFLAFGWGVYGLSMGTISFGTLTAFLQLFGQIQGPMSGLAGSLPQLIAMVSSAERLMMLENMNKEDREGVLPAWKKVGIHYKQVSFSYVKGQALLQGLSFEFRPGEIVGIVGTSGGGKTTLINLLLALMPVDKGMVSFYNGHGEEIPANSLTRGWISYVPQGNTLFSGTIEENLRFGYPDASEEDLKKAVNDACAMDYIRELPDGFQTVIGERGIGLSEGQAQRLGIARAFLRKAPILILDEATSALDIRSEIKVLQAIKEQHPSRLCIIITHRPSPLKICNRIFKLEKGRMTEVKQDCQSMCLGKTEPAVFNNRKGNPNHVYILDPIESSTYSCSGNQTHPSGRKV